MHAIQWISPAISKHNQLNTITRHPQFIGEKEISCSIKEYLLQYRAIETQVCPIMIKWWQFEHEYSFVPLKNASGLSRIYLKRLLSQRKFSLEFVGSSIMRRTQMYVLILFLFSLKIIILFFSLNFSVLKFKRDHHKFVSRRWPQLMQGMMNNQEKMLYKLQLILLNAW